MRTTSQTSELVSKISASSVSDDFCGADCQLLAMSMCMAHEAHLSPVGEQSQVEQRALLPQQQSSA